MGNYIIWSKKKEHDEAFIIVEPEQRSTGNCGDTPPRMLNNQFVPEVSAEFRE